MAQLTSLIAALYNCKMQLLSKSEIHEMISQLKSGKRLAPESIIWLAPMIDHTLLRLDASSEEISKLCTEAKDCGFATVCVYSKFIPLCQRLLQGSKVKPIAVVGFPTGLEATSAKVVETQEAIGSGALEIDMVIQTEWLRARRLREVFSDIRAVVTAAKEIPVKVILETCLLTNEEKILGCGLVKAAGGAFVKTSTGFSGGGATAADIALMRNAVGSDIGVKASGGIRTLENALEMVAAGASRIGASAGLTIMGGEPAKSSGY
jgi:deoxyribose-phosphate aldolase